MDIARSSALFAQLAPLLSRAIAQFALPPRGRVLVGASGGKDSTFLALALTHLGYEVHCLVVDLRYPDFEPEAIRNNLLGLGLNADICDLRAELKDDTFSIADRQKIETNFLELDSEACTTPCGACSRNKRMALRDYANRRGYPFIALGHHRDDFFATLLKDYFVLKYYEAHGAYDRSRFADFLATCSINENDLLALCSNGQAATMAVSLPLGRDVLLIRPMIFVSEAEIIAARDALSLPVFSSGCSHSVFSNPDAELTKRELVHLELTRRLHADSKLSSWLLPVMLSTLTTDGRPRSNPRRNRAISMPGFSLEASSGA
jgi:tRNA(Ile)-lysidine synthase TilS/MesJ